VAKILEDIAVLPSLDAAPGRVRSEPRKGRFPRFFSILWTTNAPYGAHYERGDVSRPIRKPFNATGFPSCVSEPFSWPFAGRGSLSSLPTLLLLSPESPQVSPLESAYGFTMVDAGSRPEQAISRASIA